MKKPTIVTLIGACAALLLSACGGQNENEDQAMNMSDQAKQSYADAKQSAQEAAEEASQAASQAWDAFADYSIDKKHEAVAFLEKQSRRIDQEIDELKANASNASESTKQAYEDAIAKLSDQRDNLELQIDKAQNATAETWEEVKLQSQKTWNNFTEYLNETKQNLTG